MKVPKDDRWKQCTVRSIVDEGMRLWLHCYGCHRHRYVDTLEWTEKNGVDLDTPLLLVSQRVRCTRCSQRTVTVTSEPYSNLPRNRESPRAKPDEPVTCPGCGSNDIEKSPPLRRPTLWAGTADRFMPYTIMVECECNACGNWWTQPRDFTFNSAPVATAVAPIAFRAQPSKYMC
jgi:hypothetical protein